MTTTETVPLDAIRSAGNVRRKVGDVRELAYSIDRVGILNPLTVRRINSANGAVAVDVPYELVAGHRRLAAAEKLGLEAVPVYVLDDDPDGYTDEDRIADRVAVQLIENLQREDLDALEEAEAIADLVDLLGSQKAAAEAIGRSQAHVSKRLKVRQLPDAAREAIDADELSLEDAFELTKIDDPKGVKKALAGLTGNGSRWELDRQLEKTERDKASRKAARDVSKQKHRQDVEVVAVPDIGAGWHSLEGWDGLAVDQDAHEAEPCHRLVVGFHNPWETETREVFYCADPARHDPDEGDSDVKVTPTNREAEEARRQAEAQARREAADREAAVRAAEAHRIAAGVTDRNTALKVLARFVLDTAEDPESYLAAVGADVPETPETKSWEDPDAWRVFEAAVSEAIDAAPVAKLYRAAILRVLTWTTHSRVDYVRDEPTAEAIRDLLGIDPFTYDLEATE